MATPLPPTEMVHSLQVMGVISAEDGGSMEDVAGQDAWL